MRIKKQTGRFLAFLMTLALVFGSVQMPQMVYAEETDAAQTSAVEDEQAVAEEPAVVEEAEELQADEEQTAEESEGAKEATESEITEQSEEAGEPEETTEPTAEITEAEEAESNEDRTTDDIELEMEDDLVAAELGELEDGLYVYSNVWWYTNDDGEKIVNGYDVDGLYDGSCSDLNGQAYAFVYIKAGEQEFLTKNDLTLKYGTEDGCTDVADGSAISDLTCSEDLGGGESFVWIDFNSISSGENTYYVCYTPDGGEEVKLNIDVDYPLLGFYKEAEISAENYIKEPLDYDMDAGATVYLCTYLNNYLTEKNDSDETFRKMLGYKTVTGWDEEDNEVPGDVSTDPCLTYPCDERNDITVSTEAEAGADKENKVFKVTLSGYIDPIDYCITALIDENNDSSYDAETDSEHSAHLGITYRTEGLFVYDWMDWNDDVPSVNEAAEANIYCDADLSGKTLQFITKKAGEDDQVVTADGLTLQYYDGSQWGTADGSIEVCEENNDIVRINFNKTGKYKVKTTNGEDKTFVIINVDYPKMGFYRTSTRSDAAYLRDYALGEYDPITGTQIYLIVPAGWTQGSELEDNTTFAGYRDNGGDAQEAPCLSVQDCQGDITINSAPANSTAEYKAYAVTIKGFVQNGGLCAEALCTEEGGEPNYYSDAWVNLSTEKESGLYAYDWIEESYSNELGYSIPVMHVTEDEDGNPVSSKSIMDPDIYGSTCYFEYKANKAADPSNKESSDLALEYYNGSNWVAAGEKGALAAGETADDVETDEKFVRIEFNETGWFRVGYNSEFYVYFLVDYPSMSFYAEKEMSKGNLLVEPIQYNCMDNDNDKPTVYLLFNDNLKERVNEDGVNIEINAVSYKDDGFTKLPDDYITKEEKMDGEDIIGYQIKVSKAINNFSIRAYADLGDGWYEDRALYVEDTFECEFLADTDECLGFSGCFLTKEEFENPDITWTDDDRRTEPYYYVNAKTLQEVINGLAALDNKEVNSFDHPGDKYTLKNTGYIAIHVSYDEVENKANSEKAQDISFPASIKGVLMDSSDNKAAVKYPISAEKNGWGEIHKFTNNEETVYAYTTENEDKNPTGDWFKATPDDTNTECFKATETEFDPTGYKDEGAVMHDNFWPAKLSLDVTADVRLTSGWKENSTVNLRFLNDKAVCYVGDKKFKSGDTGAVANWEKGSVENEEIGCKGTVTVTCSKTALRIKKAPTKIVYTEGEAFDPTGMEVELINGDKLVKALKLSDCKVQSISSLKTTDKSITITYGSYTATQAITVNAKPTTPVGTTVEDTGSSTGSFKVTDSGTVVNGVVQDAEVAYTKPETSNKTVTIPDTVKDKNGIEYKVTSIDANAFKNDKKLKTVKIGKNIETIGENAFSGCKSLTSVKMGNNVTTIGKNAFAKCTAIKTVTISKSVTTIGKGAFSGCKNIKKITINSSNITKIDKTAFKNLSKNATIKVPKKMKKKYEKMLKKAGFKGKVK